MKFDSYTRKEIVAALDKLAVVEVIPAVEEAMRHLNHILVNAEEWRPERWTIADY